MKGVKAIVTIMDDTGKVIYANRLIEPTSEEYEPELMVHKYRFDFSLACSELPLIHPTILDEKQRK